ncbi:caspase family protein [Streptomyces sp. NPDC097619]|uniref:HD domain-containing protein n=1 Tax=Streptomyces sp. NPDC097619 TaxID=3157228 RepID=UPI00331C042D
MGRFGGQAAEPPREAAADRRALLIGVPEVPAAAGTFPSLDRAVPADLRLLETALTEAGFTVDTRLGTGRSATAVALTEAARAVPEGGLLLLYFSGHGVRLGDVDHLVPADALAPADGEWTTAHRESLLPADIGTHLADCRAGTVLWIIDACRDALPGEEAAFGSRIAHGPPHGGFAVLTACGIGQTAGSTAEGSHFTRALAEALSPLSPPRTVEEVFDATGRPTARLSRGTQRVGTHYAHDHEQRTRTTLLCEGRDLAPAWRDAVDHEALWALADPSQGSAAARVRSLLPDLAEDCARRVHLARRRLPDPWADEDHPVRVLTRELPRLLPAGSLAPAEVAALAAAVLLREAAWADRLAQAAEAAPLETGRRADAAPQRRHLEQIHTQYAHLARKVPHSPDVALWLVHRWIADRLDTEDDPLGPDAAASFAARLLGLPASPPTNGPAAGAQGGAAEFARILTALALSVGQETPTALTSGAGIARVSLPEGVQEVRQRPLALALGLAGLLAVDVRTLPEVIAEHLAAADRITPPEVVAAVRGAVQWQTEQGERPGGDAGGTFHLYARCPHQAVHAALQELADRADRACGHAARLREEATVRESRLLAALPVRVTSRDLAPELVDGREAYEVPLLRFQLAQTEVRELLMGRQLYGNPALALRELYQNALDACRYRAMRHRYLDHQGRPAAPWEGRILIRQGEDERGRYVECVDNGVGMGLEQLTGTFTRAGSRFETSRAFRKEQAAWLRADPSFRLYPNSRFGIGVFSYFMLADEMTLTTRATGPDGLPAPEALSVEIPSSGSLFRIHHDAEPGALPAGGTRVRLYLRKDPELADLDCAKELREVLKVSDFHVEARSGKERALWRPGVLGAIGSTEYGDWLEAVPGTVWWTSGDGAVLCDGITTDRTTHGYVLNLAGEHAGVLSVSRNELLARDEEWVTDRLRAGAVHLPGWPSLCMEWLWSLEDAELDVALALRPVLHGQGLEVRCRRTGREVPLDELGWFGLDRRILETSGPPAGGAIAMMFDPWRRASHRVSREGATSPASFVGYPVPEPGDARLYDERLTDFLGATGEVAGMTPHEVTRRRRRYRIVHPRLGASLTVGDGPSRRVRQGLPRRSRLDDVPLDALWAKARSDRTSEVPPHHRGHVCTSEEIGLLYSGDSHWPIRQPWEVCAVAERHGVPAAEVLATVDRFAWLGWTTAGADEVKAWEELAPDRKALVLAFTDRSVELTWWAVVAYAARLRITLEQAETDVAQWVVSLGLTLADRPGPVIDDAVPEPGVHEALMGLFATGWGSVLTGGTQYEPSRLLMPQEYHALFARLSGVGLTPVFRPDLAQECADLPLRTAAVLTGSTDRKAIPRTTTSDVLFSAAAELGEPLGQMWELAESCADRFALPVPELPAGLADVRPVTAERDALVDLDHARPVTGSWHPVGPWKLAVFARGLALAPAVAYQRLVRYVPLGARVPALGSEQVGALPPEVPDARTLLALDSEYRVTGESEPFTALDLLGIAGRLGETVRETWARIEPYVPLMPVPPQVPAAPDVLPLWQDFALLTRHLDGHPPAVKGRVTAEHVAFAADGVDATPAWVWERLRHYAEMFGLDLQEAPPA